MSGFVPPNPVLVGVYLFAEGALLLTLSLFLSTRMPAIAAGVIGVAVFGAGWLAGVVGTLGTTLNIAALRTSGQRGTIRAAHRRAVARRHLLPPTILADRRAPVRRRTAETRSTRQGAPSWPYLLWVACWFLIVLVAAVASLERREL